MVDPISTRSHQKIVNELNLSISTQSSEIQSLKTEIIRLSRIADEKEKVLSETTENLRVLKNNTSSLQRLLHDERKRVSVLDDEKLKLTNENNGLMIGGKRLINELSSKKFQLVCVCSLLALVFISIFLVPWLFPNEYKLIVNWLWHLYH